MNDEAAIVATAMVGRLEAAWNAADAQDFGRAFAEDADFVDIRGEYHKGREAITYGHRAILETIYKGSTVQYDLMQARVLAPGLISAQVAANMHAPAGPLAGDNRAVYTFVARRGREGWQIDVFHNTLAPREISAEEQQVYESIR